MSATHNESLRVLTRITDGIRRQASREYIRERVTGQRREERRETDAEIREAINRQLSSANEREN